MPLIMSNSLRSFVEENRERFLGELKEYLAIPSISTLPEYREDVRSAASFVAESLKSVGLENVKLIQPESVASLAGGRHPLVYADWLHAPGKPTILCYGHYDVQPPDPLHEWTSPPFEPTVRGGDLYARGASDDKGQMFTHIKAVEALSAAHGKPTLNLRFLIEGEEEVGGETIAAYIAENKEHLRADAALVSDTAMYAAGTPTICTGLRGMLYMEWEAHSSDRDLHSGMYGGVAPSAIFGLIELLARCKNDEGTITIPGIYDDVCDPAPLEKESWSRLPFDETNYRVAEIGSSRLTGEQGYSVFERTWVRPTFEVHGIRGGFTGPGGKTVIPAQAVAKVSMRLVPNQEPEKALKVVRQFVADNSPEGVEVEVRELYAAPAAVVNPDHFAITKAAQALEEVFGNETVYVRCGGSVPVVGDIATHLGIPSVMMGFGLPDDRLHSPNEKFHLDNYYKAIHAVARFFELLGE
jgi:acetylornithine deacetylase/succinyl-diaminopimelate desuccinylase-like protein